MLRIAAIFTVCVVALAGSASAADELGEDSKFESFNAARFLSREGDSVAERGMFVVEYGPTELEALGARDAAEALDLVAGGFVNRGDVRPGRLDRDLRLRGGDPRGLTIYLDGVPLDHAYFGDSDLSRIPVREIAVIRVATGALSSRYGASASSGVVEILTRRVDRRFSTRFETDWGTTRSLLYSLWLGDTEGDPDHAFNYYGAASHDEQAGDKVSADFEETPDEDGGLRENSDFRRDSFYGRAGMEFNEKFRIYAGGSYDQDERGIPIDLETSTNDLDRIGHRRRAVGRLHLHAQPSDIFDIRGTAYIGEDAERLDRFAGRDAQELFRQYHEQGGRMGARLLPTIDTGRWSRIRLGADWRGDDYVAYRQGLDENRYEAERLALSIEDDIEPAKTVALSLGVAYETQSSRFETADLESNPAALVAPRGSLVFGPFSGFETYLSASGAGRFPTLSELYDPAAGDEELDPENTLRGEWGFRYNAGKAFEGTLAAFGSQTTEVIRPTFDEATQTFGRLDNAGETTTYGASLFAVSRPVDRLYLRASTTLLAALDNPDQAGLPDDEPPMYAPASEADAMATYRFGFGLGAAAGLSFVGDRRDSPIDNDDPLPYYTLLHGRVFYQYREDMQIWLAANNATDTYYEVPRHQSAPGLFVHGGLKLMY